MVKLGTLFTRIVAAPESGADSVREIVAASEGGARTYAAIRFKIIPPELLRLIAEFLPRQGACLDVGCGFGLFSAWMSKEQPDAQWLGVDLDEQRIATAKGLAARLQLTRCDFEVADLRVWRPMRPFDSALCLDCLHHLPEPAADELLAAVHARLAPGGVLVLKEIAASPWWRATWTFLLDQVTAFGQAVVYRDGAIWKEKLEAAGFTDVRVIPWRHWLPYPHLLVVGKKG